MTAVHVHRHRRIPGLVIPGIVLIRVLAGKTGKLAAGLFPASIEASSDKPASGLTLGQAHPEIPAGTRRCAQARVIMGNKPQASRRRSRRDEATAFPSGMPLRSLDRNDMRRRFHTISARVGLTLRQAMLYYGQQDLAEVFIEMEGYREDLPTVEEDGWPTPENVLREHRNGARRFSDARLRLEFCLIDKLVKGKLVATGFGPNSELDQPATPISADRWRALTPDFEKSEASAREAVITGILVFEARPRAQSPVRPKGRFRVDSSSRLVPAACRFTCFERKRTKSSRRY